MALDNLKGFALTNDNCHVPKANAISETFSVRKICTVPFSAQNKAKVIQMALLSFKKSLIG